MAVSVTYRLLTRVGSAHSSPSILKFISHPFGGACRSYAQLSKSTNYCWKFSWWWHHRVVINKRRTFKWQPACLALLNKTLLFLNDYKTLLMNNLIWLHNLQCAFSTGSTWHYTGNRLLNFERMMASWKLKYTDLNPDGWIEIYKAYKLYGSGSVWKKSDPNITIPQESPVF